MATKRCIALLLIFVSCSTSDSTNAKSLEADHRQEHSKILYSENYPHSAWSTESEACRSTIDSFPHPSSGPAEQMVDQLILALRQAEDNLANPTQYPPHYTPAYGEEFDFIVVGAGSAGAVVANRLSEVSDWRVLLLEAGGDPTKTSDIPALLGTLPFSDLDWQYKTEPVPDNCLGMINSSCSWPRGKVLGGSSTINFMLYTRGNAKDFNKWESDGNTGWNYNDVLPYFKKSEDLRAEHILATDDVDKYHNTGGYLKVESWGKSGVGEYLEAFGKGMEELGYPFNPDINGKTQTGFTNLPGTLEDQTRCSTAKAFLTPIKNRNNLKVSKYSLVTKLLIKDSYTTYGVEFSTQEGFTVRVKAQKEVVLSAGAINSPQLLMLSGIGPKDHLSNLGIPIIRNLPVGQNLQDHPLMGGLVMSVNYSYPEPSPLDSMYDLLMKFPSRLSTIEPINYASFINTVKGIDYPDMEILQTHHNQNDTQGLLGILRVMGYTEDVQQQFLDINRHSPIIVFFCSLLRPFSRGRILLQNTNSKSPPKLVSGSLTDRRDIETYLRTYDFISRLAMTEGLRTVDAKLVEIRLPNCETYRFPSAEHRECSLRHLTASTFHLSGSCKMGPSSDRQAVVDPTLKVVGLKGLRVVDASVIPTIPSAHINAAVIMIAEKASDLIKDTWIKKKQK